MLAFELTPGIFSCIKDTLRILVPDAGSARRVEAAARGLGFNTHAALRASLSAGPTTVTADGDAFAGFLTEAGGKPDKAFLAACAVQVMLTTVSRFPHIRMDDLSLHLGTDAQSWSHPCAQKAAFQFLGVLEELQAPSVPKGMDRRLNPYQNKHFALDPSFHAPDQDIATAAALHTGVEHVEHPDRRGSRLFIRPVPVAGQKPNPPGRHKETGFAFDCVDDLFGQSTRYGYGTSVEASHYADLLRASSHGTCTSHRSLTKAAWDTVRQDPGLHVFDLCAEIASLEGRPYPGRPWSEDRAKVRDEYVINRIARPGMGTPVKM